MPWLVRTGLGLVAWGACLFGVLQIGQLPYHGFHQHDICGPWGCGPPTSALLAWHGFWLVLSAPPVGLMIWCLPVRQLRRIGIALVVVALLIVAAVGVWQAATWLPHLRPGQPSYFAQRLVFAVVTLIDLPVITIGLGGLALWIGARVKQRRDRRSEMLPALSPTPAVAGATGNARSSW